MERRPLVLINGRIQELSVSDTLPGTTSEESQVYSKRTDFVGTTIIYRAEAEPGTLESAALWRIRKLILATDDDVTELWADGTATFNKIWTDRATYNYS